MAKLGRTLCAEKSKNARKPTPPTRAPKTKPNGGERTDDPAPEPPTPRRTGPRQARHGREEPRGEREREERERREREREREERDKRGGRV
jgi:hypothetical protein